MGQLDEAIKAVEAYRDSGDHAGAGSNRELLNDLITRLRALAAQQPAVPEQDEPNVAKAIVEFCEQIFVPVEDKIAYVQQALWMLKSPATPLPAESPRCPKCGFVMCQQFDSTPINEHAELATPNGTYICYTCGRTQGGNDAE